MCGPVEDHMLQAAPLTSVLMEEMDGSSSPGPGPPHGLVTNPLRSVDNYVHNICGKTCG